MSKKNMGMLKMSKIKKSKRKLKAAMLRFVTHDDSAVLAAIPKMIATHKKLEADFANEQKQSGLINAN
jgi:hypothetical protein